MKCLFFCLLALVPLISGQTAVSSLCYQGSLEGEQGNITEVECDFSRVSLNKFKRRR